MKIFSFPLFHIHLLQLENYDLTRCWRSAIDAGVSVPASFQINQITWTAKLLIVTLVSILVSAGLPLALLLLFSNSVGVVVLSVLLFLLLVGWFIGPLSIATLLMRPVDRFARFILRTRAKRKLARLDGVTVIGITGSYGKTTMKQTLQSLLKDHFAVKATPESFNKPVSVARFILASVTKETGVVIVEMGAYTNGDIADLCAIAQPDISVLCGINEAHLERFGSIENTIETKFEIATEAKEDATIILNADDDTVVKNADDYIKNTQTRTFYSYQNDERCPYEIKDKRFHEDGSGWSAQFYKNDEKIGYTKIPHLAEYILGNVVAGLLAGETLGLNPQEVLSSATNITPADRRMQPIQRTSDDILVIDDSYNGTLDGVKAALDTLDRFVGRRKIVITTGLVEIGEKSESIHQKIGRRLAQTADVIIFVETSVTDWIKDGLQEDGFTGETHTFADRREMHSAIDDITVSGDVVLFQNDWPENYK